MKTILISLMLLVASVASAQDCPGGPYSFYTGGSGGGWISVSPQCTNKYAENQTITLKAVANAGKIFDHWEGDVSGTVTPTTYTFTGMALTKTFKAIFMDSVIGVAPAAPKNFSAR